ncbi:MAG: putative collagen-binding domain-containing protein, partial [Anaerolineales bacterium]
VIQAGEHGIYVSIMVFNGWSIDNKGTGPGNAWPGHPFNLHNNINGVNGDLNNNGMGEETHTLQSPAITALQEAYVRKLIDTVNDLDNVLFEISNESPSNSQDWQYHMIDYIKSYEAGQPKQHPVGMTVEYPGGDNGELFASSAEWISPNEVGGYKDNPPAANGSKVMLSDTDHLWGIGGDRQWVWKSFIRGLNPIYMDCYSRIYCPDVDPNDPIRISLIENLGYILTYANRINLEKMVPHGELASTGYALANPVSSGAEYLVYLPYGGTNTVDLSAASGTLTVEWLNPLDGTITDGGTVHGGAIRSFTPPFDGDAALYIYQTLPPVTPTPTNGPTPTETQIPNYFMIYLPLVEIR